MGITGLGYYRGFVTDINNIMKTLNPEENTFNLLMVDLTHRCNMECANCYLPNRDIPDMDVDKLYEFHKCNKLLGTVTAVRPPARFGSLVIEDNRVKQFGEKNQADEGWINGGFFVLDGKIRSYIENENTVFEQEPLENLAKDGELGSYMHTGFWQPVDTVREKELLEEQLKKKIFEW